VCAHTHFALAYTSILSIFFQGGALYNYGLLSVVLCSSLLAVFLQVLTVKLGIATKRDLAQMCAEVYSTRFSMFLWMTAEIAIAACDLAEVIGREGGREGGRERGRGMGMR